MFSVFRMKGPRSTSTACLWTNLVATTETLPSIGTHEGIVMVSRGNHQKVPPYYHLHFQVRYHFASPLSSSCIIRARRRDRRRGGPSSKVPLAGVMPSPG